MSKVDWSLAPEGAEFYSPPFRGLHACWYKDVDGEVYLWCESEPYWSQREEMIGELIEQPKPWSGPEDGLPPVGSRVIVHECTHYHAKRFNGQLVRIVAHDEGKYAVFAADNFEYHALVAEKFKLPPTAADIAAELRETAIRELMDIAQVDCRVTAARLVDAGFKREVV